MFKERPFLTSAVGSYPQPDELRKARAKLSQKEISLQTYWQAAMKHTRRWVEFQKEIGLDVLVGGEFLRGDMAEFFGRQLGGRVLDFVPSYDNRCYRPIEYYDGVYPLDFSMTAEEFEATQALCPKQLLKHTITGPATLADWAMVSQPRYYRHPESFRKDLALALHRELRYLHQAGVKILQIDEPALTTKPKNLQIDLESIGLAISDMQKHFYLILHICYSDSNDLNKAFPHILALPVHQIHIEMANRDYGLLAMIQEHGFGDKDIGLGVIDVHTDRIETVDEIVAGVAKVRQYLPANRIHLLPDCGLKERHEEIAKAKMKVLVEAAQVCREKLV